MVEKAAVERGRRREKKREPPLLIAAIRCSTPSAYILVMVVSSWRKNPLPIVLVRQSLMPHVLLWLFDQEDMRQV
jgi:hypothetical protein